MASYIWQKSKQEHRIHQEINATVIHLQPARFINLFLAKIVTLAHSFSSEFITSSCYILPFFLNWDLNKVLRAQYSSIQNRRGRSYAMNLETFLDNTIKIEKANLQFPPVLTNEMKSSSGSKTSFTVTNLIFRFCPHEKAVSGSPIFYTNENLRNFVAQSIVSIQKSQSNGEISLMLTDQMIEFVKSRKKLFSPFSAPFLYILKSKMQQSINPYFWLLDYGTIYAPREKLLDDEIVQLKLLQVNKAYKKLFQLRGDKERNLF